MTDDLLGKKIGGYEILELIGRGGMATVYRAHQVSMNRIVALKVLPRQYLNDDTYLQRFHREVKIIAQLEHRNIVPVHDYGEENGQPYIVMRYMSGGSVDDLLAGGAMNLAQVCDIVEQIAPALDYAHSKNVLHRDLKPSNVLMDDNGGAYLTDFGIARILGEVGAGITTQGVVGTPSYMSPEQAQGQPLDNRSDVYSLGVMLFEMATGRRPFESDTPYSIAVMHVTQAPPMPRSINPAIPVLVENVILKAMSKNRDSRFTDASALAAALAQALEPPATNLYDTQPGIARPEARAPVEPAPQPVPYAPPPPSSGAPAHPQRGGTSSNFSAVQRRVRPKRRPNLLLSAALGGLLGCGLLTLLVIVLALIINAASQGAILDAQASTATAAATAEISISGTQRSLPPLDSTSQAARRTLVGEQAPDAVTTATAVTPPVTSGEITGSLIYTAERDNNFDLYALDLATRQETRLTSASANDLNPAVSPDGARVAYISNADGDYDIYVMDIDGRSERRLTLNEVNDRYPAWSPDGAWLVYSSDVRGDGNFDLYRVAADGSAAPEELFSDGARNSFPYWRGDQIVFTNGSNADAGTWEIARLPVSESGEAAGEIALLTDNDTKDWAPVLAPDGGIYYLTEGEGRSAIAYMDADGGGSRIVYDGERYEWGITVTADGQRLIFTSNATGQDELYLTTVEGDDVEQLTTDGAMSGSWVTS